MKSVLLLILLFACGSVSAQEWRDSLEVARAAYKKGDYDKAISYYESAQKKAPDNVDLSDEIAQSSYKAREFEKAENIYKQTANTKRDTKKKADSFHNLGNSRMKKKDYSGAVEAYKESLRNDPTNEKTRYNLSEAIRKMKDQQKKNENQKDQNKQDQQDQQDQNKGQGNNESSNSGDQNKQQQNNQGNSKNQSNSNSGSKNGQGNKEGDNKSNGGNLPNKSVERMLDELMKAESATKRKMGGSKSGESTAKSGKDW